MVSSLTIRSVRPLLRSNVIFSSTTSWSTRMISTTIVQRQEDVKISSIVDQIEKLTLLEASELVTQLKTRLNITEISMPSASSAPTASSTTEADVTEEEVKPKEKTVFTLKIASLKEATAKAKVIREVKAANSTMNLVEAKKFVESLPQVFKEGLSKEDAEKLKLALETAGAIVELE